MNIRTSPLVQMVNESKRPTRWWLAWIVALFLIIGISVITSPIGPAILGNPTQTDTLYQFNEAFGFGFTLLGLFLWVRLKEGRPFSSVGFRGTGPVGKFLLGLLVGAVMVGVGVAIPLLTGDLENGASTHTNLGSAALVPLLALFAVFIIQSSTEEAVVRGFMLQTGGRDLRPLVAIVVPAIIFAVVHVNFSPIPFINTVVFALAMSFLALGQGSIWLVCGIHTGWNFLQGNVFGVPVSGHLEATSLLALGPAADGREAMTGGLYGIEASLSGTLVLVVVLVVSIVYYRRKDAERASSVPEMTAA
jgi:membrane protease YdiL (CAAX protease family)